MYVTEFAFMNSYLYHIPQVLKNLNTSLESFTISNRKDIRNYWYYKNIFYIKRIFPATHFNLYDTFGIYISYNVYRITHSLCKAILL